MLLGEALPSLPVPGNRLQNQLNAKLWDIDDLLAVSGADTESQRCIAISCKSSVQATASGLPESFVNSAWMQWSNADTPFVRTRDKMMLVTRDSHPDFRARWHDIKTWVSSADPSLGLARITKPATHRKIFESIKRVVQRISHDVSDEELLQFIDHLEVFPTDFHLTPSDAERTSVARCRSLLVDGGLDQAQELWNELIGYCHYARLGNGTVDVEAVWRWLTPRFQLRDRPDYVGSFAAIDRVTQAHRSTIRTELSSGLKVSRQSNSVALTEKLKSHAKLVIDGSSGSGKSSLLKSVLDTELSDWRQVWLGPDEARLMLDELQRATLGLTYPLADVLLSTPRPHNILVLDSVEHFNEIDQQRARNLVSALTAKNEGGDTTAWRIVVIARVEALATGVPQRIIGHVAPERFSIKDLPILDVQNVLREDPNLSWAAINDNICRALCNLKALAWVVEASDRFDASSPAALWSIPAIAEHLWDYWTDGKFALQNLAMRLAEAQGNFQHGVALSELSAEDVTIIQARPSQMPLEITARRVIRFEHDLAAEWARFLRLKEIADDYARWAPLADNPLWTGSLRLLGAYLLRDKQGDQPAWDIAFTALTGTNGTQAAADILLDSLCLDPLAVKFLEEKKERLFANNGKLFVRLIKRFQHIATVPGGSAADVANLLNENPGYELYIETQYRTPIIYLWPSVAWFMDTNRETIASFGAVAVALLCEKWLTNLPVEMKSGEPTPFRKEFALLALSTAKEIQFEFFRHTMLLGEYGKTIYAAALAAAPDLPDEVSMWALEMARRAPFNKELSKRLSDHRLEKTRIHREKMKSDPEYKARFEQRGSMMAPIFSDRKLPPWPLGPQGKVDRQFREVFTSPAALTPLMRIRPAAASEVLVAVMIEDSPKEEYGSSRMSDSFGLAYDSSAFPTAYWKSPFFSFFLVNPTVALDALLALVNFCTQRWATESDRLKLKKTNITLQLDDGRETTFIGNGAVFGWAQRHSNTSGQQFSALAALEYWLIDSVEKGINVDHVISKLLSNGTSLSFLGVLVNVGKSSPTLFKGVLKPLLAIETLYYWDDERSAPEAIRTFGLAYDQQYHTFRELARKWIDAPFRKTSLRTVVAELIRTDDAFAQFVKASAEQWRLHHETDRSLATRELKAELNVDNYHPDADTASLVLTYPADLIRDYENLQQRQLLMQNIQYTPAFCRRVLNTAEIADAVLERLARFFDQLQQDPANSESGKQLARVVISCVLAVKGKNWLAAHPDVSNAMFEAIGKKWTELREQSRADAPYGPDPNMEFLAYLAFDDWLLGKEGADERCLWLMSRSDIATIVLFAVAHDKRQLLGEKWPRLLHLATLWSGLSILQPRRYGQNAADVTRWQTWVDRFVKMDLDRPASLEEINFVDVAKRVERIERIRWRREEQSEDWYPNSAEDQHSIGLDWSFLQNAFAWLLAPVQTGMPSLDDDTKNRPLLLGLWQFEIWRTHHAREAGDDYPPSSDLAYRTLGQIAKLTLRTDAAEAHALWKPVLITGAPAHYAIAHFLQCWFAGATSAAPMEFSAMWRQMIEFALEAPTWGQGTPWYYGQRLLCQVLGCGFEPLLQQQPAFVTTVANMHDLYQQWASTHLPREEENVSAFCSFLSSPVGRSLRVDAVAWVDQAVRGDGGAGHWHRPATGAALIEFLNVLLLEEGSFLRQNDTARSAFLRLVGMLAVRQRPEAFALQERARLVFSS